eukprot:15326859-Alexandrium_andersonii.AAC.1
MRKGPAALALGKFSGEGPSVAELPNILLDGPPEGKPNVAKRPASSQKKPAAHEASGAPVPTSGIGT